MSAETDTAAGRLRAAIENYEITPTDDLLAVLDQRDDDLCVIAAYLMPNQRPAAEWTAILANHFGPRAQALIEDADRFAAARFRVDHARAGVAVPAECECGCQSFKRCECSGDDCECADDCPVCDADEATFVDQSAEATRG